MSATKKHRLATGEVSVHFFAWRAHACMALLIVAALLAGCATTKAFTPPQLPGNDQALVYLIRDHYGDGDGEAQVLVNGTQVATLANNDFVAVNVPTGKNYVLIVLNRHHKPLEFTLPINRAEKIYMSFSSSDKLVGASDINGYVRVAYSRHWSVHRVSELAAQAWAAQAHKDISWKKSSR